MLNCLFCHARRTFSQSFKRSKAYFSTVHAEAYASVIPQWQTTTSLCIVRRPVVCRPLNEVEKSYKELTQTVEAEQSRKSAHEIRLLEDQIRAKQFAEGDKEDFDMEDALKQTAAELEDVAAAEYAAFKFSSIKTEFDLNDDKTVLNRALDRSLVLIGKHKIGNDEIWQFPQIPWQNGETLRQTCERLGDNFLPSDMRIHIHGNAPSGFVKYKYPKAVRGEFIGAKVFFYTAHVVQSSKDSIKTNDEWLQFFWVTQCELNQILWKNRKYRSAVEKFLIPDD